MKKMVLAALVAAFFAAAGFSREAFYNGDEYSITLHYNDRACPGDAVFVRMSFLQSKKSKASRVDFQGTQASLELIVEGKTSRSAAFYALPKAAKNTRTMLAGVPLSTWWTEGTQCSLKVLYSINSSNSSEGQRKMEFELPFSLEHKEFVSEAIDLDEANTQVKTDTSAERMEQIKKLNGILATTTADAVWQLEPFTPPTQETRRTSFFADRREYRYTTGGSSTSLHYGIDYGVSEGSPVTSCADGVVVLAETRVSTGWSVVVEHLPGLYSLYYHMSELKVKEGDQVKRGQLLGSSGSTGLATGPHLHWEMRLLGEAVNPDFFTGDFAFSSTH